MRLNQIHPDVNLPICEECMLATIDKLKNEIAQANNDLSKYTEALFELEREHRNGKHIEEEIEQDESYLSGRERELRTELSQLQREEEELLSELDSVIGEHERLESQYAQLGEDMVQLNRVIIDSDESMDSVLRKTQYCSSTLKKLKRFSLLNEAMFIHADFQGATKFGSINGLRLGRSKDDPVPWTEINAALGFLCLLVDVIVKKLDISLSQYRLLPRGSYSVIIKKSDKSTLELYADETSGGLTRFLTGRKFDSAMYALLQIVNEIAWNIQRNNSNFSLPFTIDQTEGKINGVSVCLQFNSEDNWTHAMKMLLANVKQIMSFIDHP
jgi:beclin 1